MCRGSGGLDGATQAFVSAVDGTRRYVLSFLGLINSLGSTLVLRCQLCGCYIIAVLNKFRYTNSSERRRCSAIPAPPGVFVGTDHSWGALFLDNGVDGT